MMDITSLDEYIKGFRFEERKLNAHPIVKIYIENQIQKLQILIEELSYEDFWISIPLVLGIDSKLVLLQELFSFKEDFGFTEEEVLKIVEQDYLYYNKELCGYQLNDKTRHSIIFRIK